MPEAPECRRVYEGLRSEIEDSKIVKLSVTGGRFLKKIPAGLADVTLPATVIGGGVKGKFIWLELSTGSTMWITLGMSGYWSTSSHKHSHFEIVLNTGKTLYFVDQRRFGTIKFSQNRLELVAKLDSLGVDLLNEPETSLIDFTRSIDRYRAKPICEVLMNQRVCAGVGNYIKCEALYRAGVSPYRIVHDLKTYEISKLHRLIRQIMQASYSQGGASIRNYQQVNGDIGEFVFEFEVYAQKADPHGNLVVRELTPDGRTTHWVPALQT